MPLRRAFALYLTLLTVACALHVSYAQTPDEDFGISGAVVGVMLSGYVTNSGGRLYSLGNGQFLLAVAVADGSPDNEDIAVVRYNGDGTMDETFGDGGFAIIDWDNDAPDWASAGITRDANGRIVLVGYTGDPGEDTNAAIAVLTPGGTLDPKFDGDGKLVVPDEDAVTLPRSVVVDAVGNIIFDASAGQFCCAPDHSTLRRYFPGGIEDSLYAALGAGEHTSVTLDHAGRVVWANAFDTGSGLALTVRRLTGDGLDDSHFNGGIPISTTLSYTSYPFIGLARAVVQTGNDIVLTGGPSTAFHAWAYTAGGESNTGFGYESHTSVTIPQSDVVAALVDSEDRVILAGYAHTGTSYDFAVVRLTADGIPDPTFDGDGIFTVDVGTNSDDVARDAILMPDGDLIIAGEINGAVSIGIVRIDMGDPQSLLSNDSFETRDPAQTSKAQWWRGSNLTKDKRNCVSAHTGSCAFVFKGSAAEKSVISQTVKPPSALRRAGTAYSLSAWADGIGVTALGKVVIHYADGTRDAFSMSVGGAAGYQQYVSPPFIILKDAKKLKVSFKSTAAAGVLRLDDVELLPNTLRGRTFLPLPAPPSSFRSLWG